MENTNDINQIVSNIEKLDYKGKINVLARIVKLLNREEKAGQAPSITGLKGLGKNVWSKKDIETYLRNERESWDQ